MSSDRVFRLRGERLSVLRPRHYESEDLLQRLLADFPDVLAGPSHVRNRNRKEPVYLSALKQDSITELRMGGGLHVNNLVRTNCLAAHASIQINRSAANPPDFKPVRRT